MDYVVEMSGDEQECAVGVAREVARDFATAGERHDRDNTFPRELAEVFRESGLLALNVSMRFGGWGGDIWTTVRCVEELAKGDLWWRHHGVART